ncbi:hypothetical protein LCGC14_0245130 [marine sediment metagenome]|uniref:Uncharacterized protein n=1 Tax=marine sediment metagenome TaxID=412755 RepID=A0A0F9WRP4_9ZZZZ
MSRRPPLDVRNLVCKGSIGDAFLFNAILYDPSRTPITVNQCISSDPETQQQGIPLIEKIYSLSHNVDVNFIDHEEWKRTLGSCPANVRGDPPGFRPSPIVSANRGIAPVTAYPKFTFPVSEHEPVGSYIACCPKSGKPQQGHRDIHEELEWMTGAYPKHTFVLVGEANRYSTFTKPNVLNLIGKTSLLEGMGVVSRATGFIGIQGLMAYVALSQKVPSVVYTRTSGHTQAFYGRLFPQWVTYLTMYFKSRTENPEPFHQFMDHLL